MSSKKSNKPTTTVAPKKKKSSSIHEHPHLLTIDHAVRASFVTMSVGVLVLASAVGILGVFNAVPTDFAQAQSDPTEPTNPLVGLPTAPTQPETLSAAITNIELINNELSVSFTTSGFTNQLNDNHTNFYFNTEVSTVTNKLFFAESPYTVDVNSVPAAATQLCIIVADGSNAVINNSGNCFNLPELNNTPTTPNNEGGTGAPTTEAPETPNVESEAVEIAPSVDGTVVETATTGTQNTNQPVVDANVQALNAAQTSGTTARSGGLAFVSGILLLGIVGYYIYYRTKGDRKSILKMEEKKIHSKR